MFCISVGVSAQQMGSIRGVVYDEEFDSPVPNAQVLVVETGQTVTTTDQGNYVVGQVPPGRYTVIFSKQGYVREVRGDVVVTGGQLTEVNSRLAGEFVDMEEFVVQDIMQSAPGSEAALLQLRFESPSLMDSISSELMSRAGASDAAGALTLVSGASTQDGKFAVIRGLPDRYVSSQMNGVRLPTADEDRRAVELDQFPAAVIESVQVTKSFTPDQQGDASGGAVNVVLKGIPDATIFQFKAEIGYNTQVDSRHDFLTYDGGGVNYWGTDDGSRDIQYDNLGDNWTGAVGVSEGDAPPIYKWSLGAGTRHEFDSGLTIGGYGNFFYERDASFFDNGIDDSYWVENPGDPLTPQTLQGSPAGDFKTPLFDVTQGSESVKWGGLGTFGVETENHRLGLVYLYTHDAEDTATLAEDTRGKEYFFPGYDPDDPMDEGNTPGNRDAAPYIRTETLEYTERTTSTLQLNGDHILPVGGFSIGDAFEFGDPELGWTLAHSTAELDQPDKRQFGELWLADSFNPARPPFIPDPFISPAVHLPFKPAANFNLGNLQRIWKDIEQTSNQYFVDLKLPFTQWSDDDGYLKFGVFQDSVDRDFNQDTFSNFGDAGANYVGDWEDRWSTVFPSENHPITASMADVDYKGNEDVFAWYAMAGMPLNSSVSLVGGARFESTKISIVNDPERDALWYPPGSTAETELNPGDADVSINQDNVLPAIGLIYNPWDPVTVRLSYSETIARPTFKELTPIIQQEFLGGPIFIGNPEVQLSEITNYDARVDYTYPGGLLSASWFYKDLKNPIELVQRVQPFSYTTPVNFPKGYLNGFELEARQDLGVLSESLGGLSLGGNATFINSQVTLPDDEAAMFDLPNILVPQSTRDATGAPEYLYNLYLTYDLFATNTQLSLFYSVVGDTLVAGAGTAGGNFVPSVYATEYDTLNLTLSQKIGDIFNLTFKAKNLTNSKLETVYRSDVTGGDVTKTSYTTGIDFSISIGGQITF